MNKLLISIIFTIISFNAFGHGGVMHSHGCCGKSTQSNQKEQAHMAQHAIEDQVKQEHSKQQKKKLTAVKKIK